MDIEFDIEKNKANVAKHGLDLALAILLFEEDHFIRVDGRMNYDEIREIAYGYINGRECVCVYTDRANARRIISLRKANRREISEYY